MPSRNAFFNALTLIDLLIDSPTAATTSSKAFRCVQAWLLEKPAVWVGEDAPGLAAALMVQRAPCKRPREDALHEAKRSHQQHRIELLEELLEWQVARCVRQERSIKHLRERVESEEALVESPEEHQPLRDAAWGIISSFCERKRRAELALRWFERHEGQNPRRP